MSEQQDQPFDFQENTQAMYDAVCSAPPFFIRWLVRSKLDKALKDRGCGVVTEAIMYDACKEITPENQIDRTMGVLDKHKTTTTLGAGAKGSNE
mmetsp:Transcript_23679/g.38580  ORF Transcript_23679/g.38580 Transcript_23679/m.38580 type:complete len:94 (+) Transcript_23679:165-446(+)|eukprot:CAMPEP_0178781222 /NCGR_PEP_ID=MMETSP0745-20121128/2485_1 /TAXON_ID=913974 /ORGANISM="Nitzschia punctata, Strain CCMP561" /LENGTH=93 /DNA_ID=CAMNT_0020438549 /DNA_START=57 /DNA_END=338 /DNA_ORIENTATION=-